MQIPSEFDGRLSQGKDWREIVAWVSDLPPMPQVAAKALRLVEDPACTAQELTKILSTDAALAARVLKIANSAMFSRQREITTLSQAIMLIGFKALRGIIVAATLRQVSKGDAQSEKLVWENSMASAMFASKIARKIKARWVDEIFLLALLHTLGQVVLLSRKETSSDFQKVNDLIKSKAYDYTAAEQEVYGFAHPLIGALVAKKWNFPAETCQVILHYKDPVEALESDVDKQIAVVQLADALSHRASIGSPEGYPDHTDLSIKLATHLGIPKADAEKELSTLIEETKAQYDAEKQVYG